MKYYIVYKIVNNINGKIYIVVHQTVDINDGYMGSGKNIKRAIKKYGKENFTKHIIEKFDTPEKMFEMEANLVNDEFLNSNKNYNIVIGGNGGFTHLNKNYWTKEKRVKNREKFGHVADAKYTFEKRSEARKLVPMDIKISIGKKMGDVYGGRTKLTVEEVNKRFQLISDIDLLEYGWVKKVSERLKITHTQVRRFIKEHYIGKYYQRK